MSKLREEYQKPQFQSFLTALCGSAPGPNCTELDRHMIFHYPKIFLFNGKKQKPVAPNDLLRDFFLRWEDVEPVELLGKEQGDPKVVSADQLLFASGVFAVPAVGASDAMQPSANRLALLE